MRVIGALHRGIQSIFVATAASLLLVIPTVYANPLPTVIVSEISWAGSSVSASDEWLELGNESPEVVDLAGWSLWSVGGESPELLVAIDEGQIAPDGTFLIANNAADHSFAAGESVLAVEPDLITSDLALDNSHLALELRDAQGSVIDRIGNGGPGFLRGTLSPQSMERRHDPIQSGITPNAWQLSTTQRGLDTDVPDLGTPTPSGRPTLVFESTADCRLILGGSHAPSLGIHVTDPQGATDVTTVTAMINEKPVEATYDASVSRATLVVPTTLSAGLATVTVTAHDTSGLWRSLALVCAVSNVRGTVLIDEVVAAPTAGEREFIELRNVGDVSVNLFDWSLDDRDESGSSPFTIPYPVLLVPGEYVVFWSDETKLALNNTGDDVQLVRPDGQRADLVHFSDSPGDQSWNRGEPWYRSTPSPGRTNNGAFPLAAPSQGGAPLGQVLPATVSLSDLVVQHQLLAGTVVSTEGVVTVEQGAYEPQRLLLANGEAAVEVQFPAGMMATPPAGTRLRIVGRVSTAATARLLVDRLTALTVLGHDEPPVRDLANLDTPTELQLVSGEGEVEEAGSAPVIRVGAISVRLSRRQGVQFPELADGSAVRFQGVVVSLDPLRVRVLRSSDVARLDDPVLPQSESEVAVLVPTEEELPASESEAPLIRDAEPTSVSPIVERPSLPLQPLTTLATALQVRSRIVQQLATQVLGARSEVTRSPSGLSPALVTALVAMIGLVLLWLDLLWQSIARRLPGV